MPARLRGSDKLDFYHPHLQYLGTLLTQENYVCKCNTKFNHFKLLKESGSDIQMVLA